MLFYYNGLSLDKKFIEEEGNMRNQFETKTTHLTDMIK